MLNKDRELSSNNRTKEQLEKLVKLTEEQLQELKFPIFIFTGGVKHNIVDICQCHSCGLLDDPMLMEDCNGNAYCDDCAILYWETKEGKDFQANY